MGHRAHAPVCGGWRWAVQGCKGVRGKPCLIACISLSRLFGCVDSGRLFTDLMTRQIILPVRVVFSRYRTGLAARHVELASSFGAAYRRVRQERLVPWGPVTGTPAADLIRPRSGNHHPSKSKVGFGIFRIPCTAHRVVPGCGRPTLLHRMGIGRSSEP